MSDPEPTVVVDDACQFEVGAPSLSEKDVEVATTIRFCGDEESALPPLDGGAKAWSIVVAAWCGLFCSFGFTNGFGTFQSYYQVHYPTTGSATVSLVGGLQVCVMYLTGLFIGRWIDVFGPKVVIGAGTLICCFSLMILSLTSAIWQVFLMQGLLYGVGMSFIFFPSISMASSWFDKNRAFAIGIVTGGSSIGGVLWPIIVDRLLQSVGFAWMCRVCGFIVLVLCGIATFLLEPRIKPKSGQSVMPDFSVLRKPAFTVLLFSNMVGYFGLFGVIFFIQSRATSLGVTSSLVPYMLPILNAASFPGRIIPGLLADRFGPLNVWFCANCASTIFILLGWVLAKSEAGLLVVGIFYGFSSGAWVSVLPACVPRVAGPENVGSSMGLFYCLSWPGGLAGAAIGALFINPNAVNSNEGYQNAGIFWGCCLAGGTLLAGASRLLHNPKLLAKA